MRNLFIILFFVIIVLVIILLIKRFKNPRMDTINGNSGQNGGGKTSGILCRIIRYLRRVYFICRNRSLKNDYIILSNFPIGKLEKRSGKRYIRIWFKKIYCYDLDLSILLIQERLPQDEVILFIDEFSTIASQLDYNNNLVKDNIKEFFRLFRHYTHGKGYIFWSDQCSLEIFNPVRRRTAYCYNYISSLKIKFLPIYIQEYRKIMISDEVENTITTTDNTMETDIQRFIFFINPFKWYDSFAHSDRYLAVKNIHQLKTSQTLKRNTTLKLPEVKSLYYETLSFDGITPEAYTISKTPKRGGSTF